MKKNTKERGCFVFCRPKVSRRWINNFWIFFLVVVFARLIPPAFAQGRTQDMKMIAMIIASENFRDDELLQPLEIFKKNGYTVKIASTSYKEAKGMLGSTVMPDLLISDLDVRSYYAIVFVGGRGATQYWDDPVAHKIVQDAVAADKIVGAICIAPVILARAGVLKGRRATVWSTEGIALQTQGVLYTGEKVERDGNIITADGPFSAIQFAEEIIKALNAE